MSTVSLERLRQVVEFLKVEEEGFLQVCNRACYCELNFQDHKGSCHHCDDYGLAHDLATVGKKILDMETVEFHIEAPAFLARVQKHFPKAAATAA